jgi:quinol monooxygenase YgiN
MTFHPASVDAFLALFEASAPQIRAFPGCEHLELWQDVRFANILTTYSHWHDEHALNRYRHSTLFTETWAQTKRLFAAPPHAVSQQVLRTLPPPPR